MTPNLSILRTRAGHNPWQHAAFWLVVTGLVALNLYMSPGGGRISGLLAARVVLHLLCFAVAILFHLQVLVPRFLERDHYITYLLAFLLTALATAFIMYHGNVILREQVFGHGVHLGPQGQGPGGSGFGPPGMRNGLPGTSRGFGPRAQFRPPFGKLMLVWGVQAMIMTGLALLFHLINTYVRSKEYEQQGLEAEVAALKAQLSPHFIFNSLNNIYSLALAKSDLAPDYTMKLSKITRYILHETSRPDIPLTQALDFIRDYLALERIRLGDRAKISYRIEGSPEECRITPLILLPFIENIFKHGVNPDPGQAEVDILVTIERDGVIDLHFSNRLLPETGEVSESGVGLANVRRRLELMCPNRYELNISPGPEFYTVHLRLLP